LDDASRTPSAFSRGNAAATSNPSGKGFGYRVDTSPTDPKASSTNGNDYRRLNAAPTPVAIIQGILTAISVRKS
jgi:hypothetical protein